MEVGDAPPQLARSISNSNQQLYPESGQLDARKRTEETSENPALRKKRREVGK